MGYLVKLDTQGSKPKILEYIITNKLVDYFAMDIKVPSSDYHKVTKFRNIKDNIETSIKLIMSSGIDYEFRTTAAYPLVTVEKFKQIGELIQGAKRYFIQNYVKAKKQLDPTANFRPLTEQELLNAKAIVKKYVQSVEIR